MNKKELISNIARFCKIDKFESIYELKISSDRSTALIYNTNDLWLNKQQFEILISLISCEETLYVAQVYSEKIYELKLPIKYEEYEMLDIFSCCFITSSKFDWIIVLDEGFESGIGILIGASDFVKKYISQYKDSLKDIYDLITFHYKDSPRNPHSTENLIKILSLAHPFV
jgi:hypothetical protein